MSSAALAGLACLDSGQVALAQTVVEQIDYQYDALGRLTNVAHSGSVNNGVTAAYQLDAAGNRKNVTVTTASAAPSFSISDATVTEGGTLNFTVTKTGTTSSSYTVNYGTANNSAVSGSDYNATSGTLTFAATDTTKSIAVTTIDDTTVESTETMFVNLSSASGGATISRSQGIGTINDNDTAAPSFSISGGSATEGGTITFTVTRSGSTAGSYSVSYATANNSAVAGSDYNGTSGTLTFAAGQTSQSFTVSTIDDTLVEGSETFFANLSNATGGATITTSQATGTINDNDSPPTFSISNASATEGGTLAFTVTRSGAATGTYTVNYGTANNTAVAGSDYNAASGTLTFTAAGSQTVNISTIDDSVTESTETMYVNLSGASGGATISPSQGVGTITDNDVAQTVFNITLSGGGSTNLRSVANNAGYNGATGVTYNFTLPSGQTITGSSPTTPAIDTGSWPSPVTLTLSIAGTVQGKGGTGGDGGYGMSPMGTPGAAGGTGGDAVKCGAPISISVSGALRAGGGGGGGAAGAFDSGGSATGGGGGGGGAPFGFGGLGGSGSQSGGNGETATATSAGQGGYSPLAASGGPGGAGGTFGASGGSGGANPGQAAAPGGAPGYAVRTSGTGCTASGNITGTVG